MFCGVRVLVQRHDAAIVVPRQQSGQWAFVPSGVAAPACDIRDFGRKISLAPTERMSREPPRACDAEIG